MYELSIQLIIIMLGKQIWNNFLELAWPWLINQYRWEWIKLEKVMKGRSRFDNVVISF